jgi:putative hydrolase of the HAD superfamily
VIEAVLFDFGGVMVASPFTAISQAGADAGHGPDEVLDALLGDYGSDTDHPFHRLERGEIGVAEYATWVPGHLEERRLTVDFGVLANLYARLAVHEEVVDAVRRLRAAGYRTALVTNNVKEFGDSWRSLIPLDELFDAIVDSSEVGMRKPNVAPTQSLVASRCCAIRVRRGGCVKRTPS